MTGVLQVGLNVKAKDLDQLVGRMQQPNAKESGISRSDFLRFIALTQDELDEMCLTLK